MNTKTPFVQESTRRKDVLTRRVKDLSVHFKSHQKIGSTNGAASGILTPDEMARALFAKASFDFLEEKLLEELGEIALNALGALRKFLSGNEGLLIESSRGSSHTSFYMALFDRPFIVSSIVECIRQTGFTIDALLHPVLSVGGARVSLSYLELEGLSVDEQNKVEGLLREVLQDLTLLSGDFSEMIEETNKLSRSTDSPAFLQKYAESENKDIGDFLRWLTEDSFIYLGVACWSGKDRSNKPILPLGIFKTRSPYREALLKDCSEDIDTLLEIREPLWITRLSVESPVHRRIKLTHIAIPIVTANGDVEEILSIVGIFSSKALSQESSSIPIIKRKINKLIEAEEVVRGSHDYKFIVDIIDRMPKEEALRLTSDGLRDIIDTTIDVYNRNETRLSIRPDASKRGLSILVVMPRDRLNEDVRRKIQEYLETSFDCPIGDSEYHLDLSAHALARFYFHVPIKDAFPDINREKLEEEASHLARPWVENLHEALLNNSSSVSPRKLSSRYITAFPAEYQAIHSIEEALIDIEAFEALSEEHPIRLGLSFPKSLAVGFCRLIAYSLGAELTLSQTLPILENAGFEVISESSSFVTPRESKVIFIHRLVVRPKDGHLPSASSFSRCLGPGLQAIFLGRADNDVLNSLLLSAELPIRSIALIRTYAGFLWQTGVFPRKHTIRELIASVPKITSKFWSLFDLKFNPTLGLSLDERRARLDGGLREYDEMLRQEKDITVDRILRALAAVLKATLRTNYYLERDTIAIKTLSEEIDFLPAPKPVYEVSVSSPRIEGVHLRSSPVSRGGLRWSDRLDDFRTEVLGLMKTQRIKNVFIVPSGAKGGFVLRHPHVEASTLKNAVRAAYEEFIRALLSVADNRSGEHVVHPEHVLAYDGPDPYFVVAADKGTATFSDVANGIAVNEYSYWLGDAFASGGSNGYDHKLYGITAKGAWECVIRHFNDLGIDYRNSAFSAVGIGDMSGDVFGNGLLLSRNVKLLGAFNHKHIFIDPSPDPETSFAERERLFRTPGSQWSDYQSALISKGGGILERSAKEIHISPEMRTALSISDSVPDVVNGDQLVSLILSAKVDLLWNGGIGTYVRARSESNADVNDSSNDRVRICADEVRARVVAEGGNLGFTQLARIEFSQRSGRINTDAVDNSAGVGLSDREVNIKILFSAVVQRGELSEEKRNSILKSMADEVCESVLQHNRDHAFLLTTCEINSQSELEYFKGLIGHLVKSGHLNRTLDCLPDEEDLHERGVRGLGLYRPELASCLAAVKMWVKAALLESTLIDSPLLQQLLLDYFPSAIVKDFSDEILKHPLRKNIIATQATNKVVDAIGIAFIYRMTVDYSVDVATALRAALAAYLVLDIGELIRKTTRFDSVSSNAKYIEERQSIIEAYRAATSWFTANYKERITLDELVSTYRGAYRELSKENSSYDPASHTLNKLEIIWTTLSAESKFDTVRGVYERVMEVLEIRSVTSFRTSITSKDRWENALLVSSFSEIDRSVSRIAEKLLKRGITTESQIRETIQASPGFPHARLAIGELGRVQPGVAHIAVIARQLRDFVI